MNDLHRNPPADPSTLRPAGREPAPGRLALLQAFVNTRNDDFPTDALGDGARASAWLAVHGLPGPADDVEAARARSLREALRDLLGNGTPGPDAAATIAGAADAARLTLRPGPDGVLALVPQATGIDAALGVVLAVAQGAMADGTLVRLRTCRQCRWAFYDRSRNRTGQWCSMEICGNRTKVRRHRARGRAAT